MGGPSGQNVLECQGRNPRTATRRTVRRRREQESLGECGGWEKGVRCAGEMQTGRRLEG